MHVSSNPVFDDGSCTHTGGTESSPWWWVDLGATVTVRQVSLYNRIDLSKYHLIINTERSEGSKQKDSFRNVIIHLIELVHALNPLEKMDNSLMNEYITCHKTDY